MKYEIRGTYKFILGILLVILLASTIIQLTIANNMNTGEVTGIPVFMMFLSAFVIFGAFITVFFYIVNSFRKELYDDRGYLTFALPLTGNQIVASKLLVAIMWNIVIAAFIITYNALLYFMTFRSQFKLLFNEIFQVYEIRFVPAMFTSIFYAILIGALMMIVIYFAIALSKVSIKNKRIGGMWFIIFLVLIAIIGYTSDTIGGAMPYYLDINTIQVIAQGSADVVYEQAGQINIASFITELLFGVLFFFGTGYLLNNKVEL